MIIYQAAERYAKALFRMAASPELKRKRLTDLEEIDKRIHANPRLLHFLYAPQIPLKDKEDFLRKILDKNFDPALYKLIFYMLEKKRLDSLGECTKFYRQLVFDSLGIVGVRLIASASLNKDEIQAVKLKITQQYPGKEIVISQEIDPKILGGVIAIIGSRCIDFSVRNRLANLKEQLLAIPV